MVIIGYIKGYDFCVVTKKKLEKEEFLSELINENPNIKEEMMSVLDNNGYIIGLTKKKVLKLAYLFDLNEKVLTFRNKILTKEIDEKIEQYIADIVFATRYPDKYNMREMKDYISFGASPRASINLALAARAYAFIKRRGYVIPEDVRAVAHDVLRHRIGLSYEAEANNMTADEIVSKILNSVEVP